jgi:hypothetical protein
MPPSCHGSSAAGDAAYLQFVDLELPDMQRARSSATDHQSAYGQAGDGESADGERSQRERAHRTDAQGVRRHLGLGADW